MDNRTICRLSGNSLCDSPLHRQVRQFKSRWQMRWAALDDAISSESKWHKELRKTLDHVLCHAIPEETLYWVQNNGKPDWMQNWVCTVLVRAFLCAVWPDPRCVGDLDHQFLALDSYQGFSKQRPLLRLWKTWPLSNDLPAKNEEAWPGPNMMSKRDSFEGDSVPFPRLEQGHKNYFPVRIDEVFDVSDLEQIEASAGRFGISYPTSTNSLSRSPLEFYQRQLMRHCILVSLCCAGRPRPPPRSLKQLLNTFESIPLRHTLFGDYTSPLPAYSIGSKVYDLYTIETVTRAGTNFVTYTATAFLLSSLPKVILTAIRHPRDYTRATSDSTPAQRKYIVKLIKKRQKSATYFDTFVYDGLIWTVERKIDWNSSYKKPRLVPRRSVLAREATRNVYYDPPNRQ